MHRLFSKRPINQFVVVDSLNIRFLSSLLHGDKTSDFGSWKRFLAKEPRSSKSKPGKQSKSALNKSYVRKPSTEIFKPLKFEAHVNSDENVGVELAGKLDKSRINQILTDFRQNDQIIALATESGLTSRMFNDVLLSFRMYCLNLASLPADLYIKLSDVIKKAANVTDLYPYFLNHAYEVFPHLQCMDELKQVSDLTEPANWFVEAREIKRKIIYHAGPTNSGKTHAALQSFLKSSSGIYCGPLKLLATEVFMKANNSETKCDLLTGEERKFADKDAKPAEHIACTVEMANLEKTYDVAVIDEIQMIRDPQRGWAWTRAFLGIKAKTIHVCGDRTSIDLISDLTFLTGDDLDIKTYERLTPLTVMKTPVESFDKAEPGDCFVCFSKPDIWSVSSNLEKRGFEVAVIYGSMPPGVKLAQAARFNDPNDKCKILVATDAIGMGLNLNIRRVIFYSLRKPQFIENKDQNNLASQSPEINYITTSQALQISGRAGRFNTQFKDGFVTAFKNADLPILHDILKQPLEKTERAGLHPTADQIELFGYHLPNYSLVDLIRVFISICRIDDGQYFLCKFEDILYLASLIDHIPLKLKVKYTFASSPISEKQTFVCACFVKFVRWYSNNSVVTASVLKVMLNWPLKTPNNFNEVSQLESVYDVLDLYLWLGYRFPEIFSEREECREMRIELEKIIYEGVKKLSFLNQTRNQEAKRFVRHAIKHEHHKRENQNEFVNPEQIKNMFSHDPMNSKVTAAAENQVSKKKE